LNRVAHEVDHSKFNKIYGLQLQVQSPIRFMDSTYKFFLCNAIIDTFSLYFKMGLSMAERCYRSALYGFQIHIVLKIKNKVGDQNYFG
jgi:hypothetical protein